MFTHSNTILEEGQLIIFAPGGGGGGGGGRTGFSSKYVYNC